MVKTRQEKQQIEQLKEEAGITPEESKVETTKDYVEASLNAMINDPTCTVRLPHLEEKLASLAKAADKPKPNPEFVKEESPKAVIDDILGKVKIGTELTENEKALIINTAHLRMQEEKATAKTEDYKPKLGRITEISIERTVQIRQYEPIRVTCKYVPGIDDPSDRVTFLIRQFNAEVDEATKPLIERETEPLTYDPKSGMLPNSEYKAPITPTPFFKSSQPQTQETNFTTPYNGNKQDPESAPSDKQHKRTYAIWMNELGGKERPELKPKRFATVGEMEEWLRSVGK